MSPPAMTVSGDGLFRAALDGRVPAPRLLTPRREERTLSVTATEYMELADSLEALLVAARELNADDD